MNILAGLIRNNKNLLRLYLSNNYISITGFSTLMQGVFESQLVELHMSQIILGDDCIPYLLPVINNSKLQILNLSQIGLTSFGIGNLFSYLNKRNLKCLDLSKNTIGDAAGKPLQQALAQSSLQELRLTSGKIYPSDIQASASKIPASQLIKIDLSDNLLGNDFLKDFSLGFLPTIPNSEKLTESQDDFDFDRMITNKHSGSKLEFINLQNNQIDMEGTIPICKVLPSTLVATNQLNLENSLINTAIVATINGCPYIHSHTYISSTSHTPPQNLSLALPLILLAFNGSHKQIAPLIKCLLLVLMITFLVKVLNAGPISLLSGVAFFAYQTRKKSFSEDKNENSSPNTLG